MTDEESLPLVGKMMLDFSASTGLSASGPTPCRYLWTDAFAVCNFLNLYTRTGNEKYKFLAVRLIDQVHHILGKHRQDDSRFGWISGFDEEEGEKHPTAGGLRIGKTLNERKAGEPLDERSEWDRDGQYYHYLTKWMHALSRTSHVTGEQLYLYHAVEMAKAVHQRFTYRPFAGGEKRMYWKMSIDLSYALVPSMGHHDPLDGLITYSELQTALSRDVGESLSYPRDEEIADMAAICQDKDWTTDDPLGLGGVMSDAYRAGQLIVRGNLRILDLLEDLLDSSLAGLQFFVRKNHFHLPAAYRLAFRELGLSIGLRALRKLQELMMENPGLFKVSRLQPKLEALTQYERMIDTIETFWLQDKNQKDSTWIEHREINRVMLATSLMSDGFLSL